MSSSAPVSAFGPLQSPVFRLLWLVWCAANTTMWMNDVASAWLMTSLAPSPLWVALVQAASTLPVFLLGLPSGALADILDRRRYFIVTQFWLAAVASVSCALLFAGWMNASLLLALTFLNGIGLAMRWPVFAALLPEVLPREHLPQGLALNGIAMNGARILGPLIAGAIIASAGSAWVFALNATLSLASAVVLIRWQREHHESPLGRERLGSAIRVGVQFVRQSPRMKGVLVRISLFFLNTTALMALMPLIAQSMPGGGAGAFTLLLSSMGVGAIASVLFMPRIRLLVPMHWMIFGGAVMHAVGSLVTAFSTSLWTAMPAMALCGIAWITVANSHTVIAQMALPDWVRARGMSIYQMAIMGSTAVGAALWGQVATWTGIHTAVAVATCLSVLLMGLAQRLMPDRGTEEDLTPSNIFTVPDIPAPDPALRLQTRIEYLIDPARAPAFLRIMEKSRRARLSQGALDWQLLHDVSEPGRYIEQIIDESWTEHLRRFDRLTASDAALRERRLAFHRSEEAPRVTRYLIKIG